MSSSSMCVLRGLGCFQCGYTRNTRSISKLIKKNRSKSKLKIQIARMKKESKKKANVAAARPTSTYNV